jgi:hypothetical protein
MQTMKKYIYIIMAMALTSAMVGCQTFEPVEPFKPATEADLEGYTIMSINDFKQEYFYNTLPEPGGTVKGVEITDKVAICGKVISSDELGNTYRSLYIQDVEGPEKGGIEIKVGKGSLYTFYKPGQVLYIKADGLVLGNYRWVLSLGGKSAEADYSNGYIDIQTTIDEKILRGEVVGFQPGDTLVINSSNVAEIMANDKKYLSTLCRFENIESYWGEITKSDNYSYDGTYYPSFLENVNEVYTDWAYTDTTNPLHPEGLPVTWAYSYNNNSYYGSCIFLYTKSLPFLVRTSGYSRFALNPVPADGAIVDMTAILAKYCSKSGGYTKYQLVLNTDEDVVVK